MSTLVQSPHVNPASLGGNGTGLWWLGQAGFLIEINGLRIVIDPYLSDSLAKKYKGKRFPHVRMTPAPVAPDGLTGIDWVLCTHAHTDHMDPDTLPILLATNPSARVLVPRSAEKTAIERGVPSDRLVLIDSGERVDLSEAVSVTASPAAHETRLLDADGAHLFLGFVIAGQTTIWHSGDTVPFDGLLQALAPFDIDLALLPVNGRDAVRAANGIPGNLTLAEALSLSKQLNVRAMIGHHLDLFDFNTLERAEGDALIADIHPAFVATLAQYETRYCMQVGPDLQL